MDTTMTIDRFAPIRGEDGNADLPLLGEIQEAVLAGDPVSDELRDAYEAIREDPLGGNCLMAAREAFNALLRRQVGENDGTIVTETIRWETGRDQPIRERRVERFVGTRQVSDRSTAVRTRTGPRPRGAGRPKGQSARSSAKSGDSGNDSEGSEPPGRTCECDPECGLDISHRAPQARYLNDTHAAFARQKRKRARERDWNPAVSRADAYLRHEPEEVARVRRRVEEGCRCNGHHIADPDDHHCVKCGHDRAHGGVVAGFIAARSVETRRPRRPELFA